MKSKKDTITQIQLAVSALNSTKPISEQIELLELRWLKINKHVRQYLKIRGFDGRYKEYLANTDSGILKTFIQKSEASIIEVLESLPDNFYISERQMLEFCKLHTIFGITGTASEILLDLIKGSKLELLLSDCRLEDEAQIESVLLFVFAQLENKCKPNSN